MRALVTGGSGFIGAHVVRALVLEGHEVRVLHVPRDPLRNLRDVRAERVVGDVTSQDDLRRAMRGCDTVFHLAALFALWTDRPQRMRDVNVGGTANVLACARELGVRRVVHTSSIARFGGQGPGRDATERSAFRLGSTGDLYSQTKYEAHELAVEAARAGQDVVIAAPCGPLGPGDVGPTPTGRLLLTAAAYAIAVVTPSETNFADVRDMALGHLLAASRGRSGEAYLLGHENVSMLTISRWARKWAGKRRRILSLPHAVAKAASHATLWAARRLGVPPLFTPAAIEIARLGLRADCRKAKTELGLPSRSLETSVFDALDWFAGEGHLPAR